MQAVILAAGRGKRMGELCAELPKPLLRVHGQTLLERTLTSLPSVIDEVIIVVGYHKEKIIEAIGKTYANKKITYVVMEELSGTASALWLCAPLLIGPTLVLMGDDIYGVDDMGHAVEHAWYMGVKQSPVAFTGGKIVVENSLLKNIDTAGGAPGDFENTGMYVISPALFTYPMVQAPNGEFGLPHTIAVVAQDIPVIVGEVRQWIRITAPEDLRRAEEELVQ